MAPRHNGREKVAAVVAAKMTSQRAAARTTGIPQRTISHWMHDPRLAQIVSRAQESFVEEGRILIALGVKTITEVLLEPGAARPQDVIAAAAHAIEKGQLLSGRPTSRVAHEDVTDDLDDHESELLRAAIDRELARARRGQTAAAAPSNGGATVR